MTDAIEHGRTVLSAILAARPDLLRAAQLHLQPSHFTDAVQAALWTFLERYADQAGGVLPRSALADILRSSAPGTAARFEDYYDSLLEDKPGDDAFKWSVEQLRELAADRDSGLALTEGMQILTQGRKEGKTDLRGHADARAHVLARFHEIERDLSASAVPEGDMRAEGREIKDDYARREAQREQGTAVATGIEALDAKLGGGQQRGELGLVAGYTSAGKSKLAASWAHHAVVEQRRNVVIFTAETLRAQVRFGILARHSCEEQFGIADQRGRRGINTRDMKAGTLPDKNAFARVLHDFSTNPDYGHCYIAQVPRGATMSTLEARLTRLARQWIADLVIIDYLALLKPEGRWRDRRESLVEILQEAGEVANTYQDGLGVPVLSPWQVRREDRDEASKKGGYTLSALAETAEASNRAHVVLSVLEPDSDDSRGRAVPLKLQVLKNRDGERGGDAIELTADYATAFFAEAGAGTSHEDLIGYGESEFG